MVEAEPDVVSCGLGVVVIVTSLVQASNALQKLPVLGKSFTLSRAIVPLAALFVTPLIKILSVSNVEMLNAAHDRVFISGFAVHPMTSSSLLSQNTLMLELVPVM